MFQTILHVNVKLPEFFFRILASCATSTFVFSGSADKGFSHGSEPPKPQRWFGGRFPPTPFFQKKATLAFFSVDDTEGFQLPQQGRLLKKSLFVIRHLSGDALDGTERMAATHSSLSSSNQQHQCKPATRQSRRCFRCGPCQCQTTRSRTRTSTAVSCKEV